MLKQIVICVSPRNCEILYFCNLTEENVNASDRYLVKNVLVAGKKAIRRNRKDGFQHSNNR